MGESAMSDVTSGPPHEVEDAVLAYLVKSK